MVKGGRGRVEGGTQRGGLAHQNAMRARGKRKAAVASDASTGEFASILGPAHWKKPPWHRLLWRERCCRSHTQRSKRTAPPIFPLEIAVRALAYVRAVTEARDEGGEEAGRLRAVQSARHEV